LSTFVTQLINNPAWREYLEIHHLFLQTVVFWKKMDNPLDGKRYGLLNKLFKFSQLHELNLFNTTLPFHAEFKPMQEKKLCPIHLFIHHEKLTRSAWKLLQQ
jgi:hypothetical protein